MNIVLKRYFLQGKLIFGAAVVARLWWMLIVGASSPHSALNTCGLDWMELAEELSEHVYNDGGIPLHPDAKNQNYVHKILGNFHTEEKVSVCHDVTNTITKPHTRGESLLCLTFFRNTSPPTNCLYNLLCTTSIVNWKGSKFQFPTSSKTAFQLEN